VSASRAPSRRNSSSRGHGVWLHTTNRIRCAGFVRRPPRAPRQTGAGGPGRASITEQGSGPEGTDRPWRPPCRALQVWAANEWSPASEISGTADQQRDSGMRAPAFVK
jgi:hypothetical protein